ncbi:MAG: phosphoribosyltransferase family protein [Candidatus Aceula meridiana]|nr:phosphoribosyltransferase family protein [Candidatus Aceula meridiana]
MKNVIHLFKYRNKIGLRHLFQKQMVTFINDYRVPIKTFDGLVAVPLHPSKMRERQYNQSEILSEMISRVFNVPVLKNTIIRAKATKPQALLNEKERWTNVKDAFRIRQPLKLEGQSILIIDDLMTTGATVCEIALTLKNSGAKDASALTLAIA